VEHESDPTGDVSPSSVSGPAEPARPRPRRRRRPSPFLRALRAGLPVEGTVEKVVKGGYEVRVGSARAFCPHSQIELQRVEEPEAYVGKTLAFRVLEVRRGGDEAVVSRRALLEEERAEQAKAVRATLLEGAVMRGRVARLADFGAFVDLGAGVIGLVHVSEISYGRIAHPSEAVQVGDSVWVRILKLDEQTGRISLSIRQAQEDPWKEVGSRFEKGKIYPGTVRRLASFGAFVELGPGLEALAPAREFPPARSSWSEGLEPGSRRDWVVLAIEPERRRITVAPWAGEGFLLPGARPEVGATVRARVQRADAQGLRIWLGPTQCGFVPREWTGVGRPAELLRRFPQGADLSVEVVEISEETGPRCAVAGVKPRPVEDRAGKEDRRQKNGRPGGPGSRPQAREDPPSPPAAFGTNLGEALRAAFDKRDGK
jgi:ribosomal protein S1